MEHLNWVIEPDNVSGLLTKLKGGVRFQRVKGKPYPEYGEIDNDGSVLLFSHQLMWDAFSTFYRRMDVSNSEYEALQDIKSEIATEIIGYTVERGGGPTPFKKRITADNFRDALVIFEQEYKAFLDELWSLEGSTGEATLGSRGYVVEGLEVMYDNDWKLNCRVVCKYDRANKGHYAIPRRL